jgi:hypothetical protein
MHAQIRSWWGRGGELASTCAFYEDFLGHFLDLIRKHGSVLSSLSFYAVICLSRQKMDFLLVT